MKLRQCVPKMAVQTDKNTKLSQIQKNQQSTELKQAVCMAYSSVIQLIVEQCFRSNGRHECQGHIGHVGPTFKNIYFLLYFLFNTKIFAINNHLKHV